MPTSRAILVGLALVAAAILLAAFEIHKVPHPGRYSLHAIDATEGAFLRFDTVTGEGMICVVRRKSPFEMLCGEDELRTAVLADSLLNGILRGLADSARRAK